MIQSRELCKLYWTGNVMFFCPFKFFCPFLSMHVLAIWHNQSRLLQCMTKTMQAYSTQS